MFVWPGVDLRPAQWISKREIVEDTCVLGPLPDDWFETVKQHLLESHAMRVVRVTKRSM